MAFPDGWGRRCELVTQHAQVEQDCTDFSMLVHGDSLPSEIFDADGSYPALNGGGDLRFSSDQAGDSQLPCEIESFVTDNDPANGKAAIWTKRTLSSASNTSTWIWYRKSGESQPAEDSAYGKEAVYDANYVMVQHMNQIPDGTAGEIVDSTSNDNDGTTSGMDSADQVTGQIDGSLKMEGGDDYVQISTSASLNTLDDATLSVWVKFDDITEAVMIFGPNATATDRVQLKKDDDFLRIYNDIDDIGIGVNSAAFINTDTWYYINFVVSGTVWKAYSNNAIERISHDFGKDFSDLNDGFEVLIGTNRYGTSPFSQWFNGIIDEVRSSNVARSAGWIATEYNSQYSPITFLIPETPETPVAYSEQFKDLLSEISAKTTAQFLDLYTEIGTRSQIFKDLLSEIIVKGEQVYDFSCNIDTKAQSIFDLLSEISAEKLQLLDLPTDIETKAQQLYDLLSAISVKSADQLQDLFTEIRAAKQSHKDLLSEIIAGSEKYYDLISDIRTKKQRLKDLITEISATAETEVLKYLLSEIAAGKVQHSDLNTEIETGAQEIKNLLSEISASREQMVDLVSDISIGIEHFFDLSTEVGIKAQSFKDLLSDISVGAEVEVFSDLLSEISAGVESIYQLKTLIQAANEELFDLSVEITTKGQIFYELSSEIAATYVSFPRYVDLFTQIAAGAISFAQVRREFTVMKRATDFTIVPRTIDFTIVK